jgi:hypothetical protein
VKLACNLSPVVKPALAIHAEQSRKRIVSGIAETAAFAARIDVKVGSRKLVKGYCSHENPPGLMLTHRKILRKSPRAEHALCFDDFPRFSDCREAALLEREKCGPEH